MGKVAYPNPLALMSVKIIYWSEMDCRSEMCRTCRGASAQIGIAAGTRDTVARIHTVAFSGIDVLAVDAQVTIASGLPAFTVVGLPDKAVGESRERVRAALHALGLALPPKRITVNLAPADLAKEGSHFDLPIALALLVAMEILPQDEIEGYAALGELGLDGTLAAVTGVL